ncbi:restriction endonuclease subunit S [Aeromonas caviae]
MKYVKLQEIVDIVRGVTFSKSEGAALPDENRYPVIRAGSIQNKLLVNEDQIWVLKEKIKQSQLIRKNDIIMCTSSGSADLVGKCAISPSDFDISFGAFCAGLRPIENKVIPSFLFHYLRSPAFRNWSKNAGGANIKNLRISELADFEILLPSLEEQKRIAAILDKADAILQKRQQAIALADDFLRSVFLDMFGDPIANPKKWDMQPIGKLLQIKHGFAFKSEFFTSKGEYILMTPGNFFESGGYRNRQEKQNYYNGNIPDGYILNAGNLLVAMTEQATGLLGSCLVVPDAGKFLHNQRLGLLKFNQDELTPEYLYYLFNNESVRQAIQVSATGTKVRHTSPNKIEEIISIVPDIKTQVRFSEIVQFIAKVKNNLEPSESESKILFNSLSQKAFSGQL